MKLQNAWIVSTLLTLACEVNAILPQSWTGNEIGTNASFAKVFEMVNNVDLQNIIGDLQKDGRLVELVSSAVSSNLNINRQCVEDIGLAITSTDMWAVKMLDAIGKPHSGILYNLDPNWLGSYDECVGIQAITYSNDTIKSDPVHHFDGKYCKIGIPVPFLTNVPNPMLVGDSGNLKLGICLPDSCNSDDLKTFMTFVGQYVFNTTSSYEPEAECHDGIPMSTKAIVAICVLSMLGLLVVFGTLYDIYLRLTKTDVLKEHHKEEPTKKTIEGLNGDTRVNISFVSDEKINGDVDMKSASNGAVEMNKAPNGDAVIENGKPPSPLITPFTEHSILEKIFLSFSVYSNGLKILSTNQSKGALTCVNGIRFLSMTWVILGHSLRFDVKNTVPYYFQSKIWQWTFYGIFSATVSVDTFFTLSGLLVAYLTLKELSKRGGPKKLNWFMFYFHRYWRLTPAYMLSLMVYATLVRYFGEGPKWPQEDVDGKLCTDGWWTNILYINNYFKAEKMCFGWSWYLANDMQFYVLSPLIFVPLYLNAAAGYFVAFLFLAGTTVARAVIAKQHEYTALVGGFVGPKPKDEDFFSKMYAPGHTRMGPYIIGLLVGYLLYKYKDTFKMKRVWNLLGWFCCMAIIVLVIYGVYPDDGKHFLTVDESVAYVTLHRTAWAIAVSWIIFSCATGHGGWINDFLSWSPFVVLGRLSYCTYLVHIICLQFYDISARENVYQTDFDLPQDVDCPDGAHVMVSRVHSYSGSAVGLWFLAIYYYIGNVVISYFVAFGTSLVFEAPMMGLEKVFFRRT